MSGLTHAGDKVRFVALGALLITAGIQVAGRFTDRPQIARLTSIGDSLPTAEFVDLQTGSAVPGGLQGLLYDLATRCAVLYFFDPECPACRQSAPDWSGITRLLNHEHISAAWVLVSGEPREAVEFLEEFDITAPAFAVAGDQAPQRLGLPGVPAVWAVNDENRIEFVRVGVAGVTPPSLGGGWCADAT